MTSLTLLGKVGRQKGFAPLPTSITRTFSLLKDFEFVDDVGGSHGQSVDDDGAGHLMQAGYVVLGKEAMLGGEVVV